jgi:hypothetical protein
VSADGHSASVRPPQVVDPEEQVDVARLLLHRPLVTGPRGSGHAIIRCGMSCTRHAPREVVMLRIQAIISAALLFAVGCSAACAGDFLPRAAGGVTVAAADPGARTGCPEAGSAAMSESDSTATARSAASTSSSSTSARRAAHVGADEVAVDTHSATPSSASDEDKSGGAPAAPHKVRSSLRWQSLLPGVMK